MDMKATANLVGDRVVLKTPWMGREGVAACKSVRGARWNPSRKAWTYPLFYEVCVEIREKVADPFHLDLEIGPELWQWAANEKARLAAKPNPKSLHRVPLPRVAAEAPKLMQALDNRPFQTVGASWGATNKEVILADEAGLGKTLQAIAMVIEANIQGPILVVAPKVAATVTWPTMLAKWVPDDEVIEVGSLSSTPAQKRAALIDEWFHTEPPEGVRRTWYVTNDHWVRVRAEYETEDYEQVRKKWVPHLPELFGVEWSSIIVDESHESLICTTANRNKWTQVRVGMGELRVKSGGLKVAMSGTPMRGKVQNFWGTLHWLRPKVYTSYWKWADEFFDVDRGFFGTTVNTSNVDKEKLYGQLSEVMLRRTKDEVAQDLPAKIYGGTPRVFTVGEGGDAQQHEVTGVWLEMSKRQKLQTRQIINGDFLKALDKEGMPISANGLLSQLTRLKQIAVAAFADGDGGRPDWSSSSKFDWLVAFLNERGIVSRSVAEGTAKVVVATQFSTVAEGLYAELDALGIPAYLLTGSTSGADRKKIQEAFQHEGSAEGTPHTADEPRVFILSTKAGGVSLTLDAADDVVIMDETWIPDDQLQVEDRCHRISRPDHQVSIWYLRSIGSVEETVAAVTGGRREIMEGVMDKTRLKQMTDDLTNRTKA